MQPDRSHPLESHFRAALGSYSSADRPSMIPVADLWGIFRAQAASRLLDLQARALRERGLGHYTIGSAGHESNAYLAAALRVTDPALVHYRSGAFYMQRAGQVPNIDGVRDVLLSLTARRADPTSGGRHKVFGRAELSIIPATSTIGSHLPRAVGIGFAIGRAARMGVASRWPSDAVAVASFGDASANHASTLAGINAAVFTAHQGLPMPLLAVCEDNGIGISVPTPPDWVAAAYGERPGLHYLSAHGEDPDEIWQAAHAAAKYVRLTRRPAFLHLRMVRFLGHAGSDAEIGYRSPAAIEADYPRDPLLATARRLVDSGATLERVLGEYDQLREHIDAVTAEVIGLPTLSTAAEVIEPLAPRRPSAVRERAATAAPGPKRSAMFSGTLPEREGPLTLAQQINRALTDVLAAYDEALVFGEDVAAKGGVYGVTARLARRAGRMRVFDTLLDETSILGLALGTAVSGLLPIPEIQYLAYLHNALDQIRGEAATTRFFSAGSFGNGMVVRIAGLAYQKGFGGHFHNDNSLAALCDIPGVVVAVPSRGDDAAAMLRTLAASARLDGTVGVLVEPIALYHERDLYQPGDGRLLSRYLPPDEWAGAHVEIGQARRYLPDSSDIPELTIITMGNGVPMSLRVGERLNAEGYVVAVLDLRWARPLPLEALAGAVADSPRLLIADETRRSGGVSEAVTAALMDSEYDGLLRRVCSADSFIPLADAARLVLLSEDDIELAARQLLGRPVRREAPPGRSGREGPGISSPGEPAPVARVEPVAAAGFDIAGRRIDYKLPRLDEAVLPDDPVELFAAWLDAVAVAGVAEPNACVLSTAGDGCLPRGRTVLLRGYADGFRFFTNYLSGKGRHLAENPQASMCFPWLAVHRQVIVTGAVRRLSEEDSDAYFASRPPQSQVASALSPQSQVLSDLGGLLRDLDRTLADHPAGLTRPAHWGGYRLDPDVIEFWQGNTGRLHDRFRYRRDGDRWVRERLAP